MRRCCGPMTAGAPGAVSARPGRPSPRRPRRPRRPRVDVGHQAADAGIAGGGGVDLLDPGGELVEVGGVDGAGAEQAEAADGVVGQAEGLDGARPGEHLVEQDQAAGGRRLEDLPQAGGLLVQAPAAPAGALGDGEVAVDGVRRAEPGAGGGEEESGLEEHLGLTDGPGVGGLAAAVGAGEDPDAGLAVQADGVGDHAAGDGGGRGLPGDDAQGEGGVVAILEVKQAVVRGGDLRPADGEPGLGQAAHQGAGVEQVDDLRLEGDEGGGADLGVAPQGGGDGRDGGLEQLAQVAEEGIVRVADVDVVDRGEGPPFPGAVAPPAEEALQQGGAALHPLRADAEQGGAFGEQVSGEVDPDRHAGGALQGVAQDGGLLLEGPEPGPGDRGGQGLPQGAQGRRAGRRRLEGLQQAQADGDVALQHLQAVGDVGHRPGVAQARGGVGAEGGEVTGDAFQSVAQRRVRQQVGEHLLAVGDRLGVRLQLAEQPGDERQAVCGPAR